MDHLLSVFLIFSSVLMVSKKRKKRPWFLCSLHLTVCSFGLVETDTPDTREDGSKETLRDTWCSIVSVYRILRKELLHHVSEELWDIGL